MYFKEYSENRPTSALVRRVFLLTLCSVSFRDGPFINSFAWICPGDLFEHSWDLFNIYWLKYDTFNVQIKPLWLTLELVSWPLHCPYVFYVRVPKVTSTYFLSLDFPELWIYWLGTVDACTCAIICIETVWLAGNFCLKGGSLFPSFPMGYTYFEFFKEAIFWKPLIWWYYHYLVTYQLIR